MLIILLVLSGCQIPICSLFRLFALHLMLAASVSELLKFAIHSLQLFKCVPAPTLLVMISRLTINSSGVPVRLTPFSLCLRFSFCWPLCVNCAWIIYVLSYLLTYLLTCKPADESVVCFTVHLWVCVCMYEGIVDLLRDVFWQNRFYVETKLKTDLATELKNLFISVVSDRHITALIRKWCCFSVK